MTIHTPAGNDFDSLAAECRAAFDRWMPGGSEWDDDRLNEWARRAFALQFAENSTYRKYCETRRVRPGDVSGWRDVPPVPTAAFRAVDLIVGPSSGAKLTFLTSGTSRGTSMRGRHLVRSPDLYRASLRATFRAFVLEGEVAANIVTLPPSFTYDPTSSLGWMLDDVRAGFASEFGGSVATADGVDWTALDAVVADAVRLDLPLCLLGTTLGFAEWLERLTDGRSITSPLPSGSRLMDTGGVKAREGLERAAVLTGLCGQLGLRLEAIVNEFGMTELLSQRYGHGDPGVPLLGPPWLRSWVLDPVTLEELPDGETGILCHYDLANLGSVCSVLTEDRGRIVGEGIEWIGRTEGAPPRGCSLATAELLEAQEHV